jgi:hypothetical protein
MAMIRFARSPGTTIILWCTWQVSSEFFPTKRTRPRLSAAD